MAILRRSNLDITLLEINGVDYLVNTEGVTAQMRITSGEADGLAWRHKKNEALLREFVFSVPMFLRLSNFPRTNLDVTLFNIGTNQFLPDVESFSIDIATEIEPAHPLNSYSGFPVPAKTDVTATARILSNASTPAFASLLANIRDGDREDVEVALSVAAGTATFTMPMIITDIAHAAQRSAIQAYDVTFRPNAVFTEDWGITADFNAVPLLKSVLTGTAFVTLEFVASPDLSYSGSGLITRGSFNVQKRGLIRNEIEITAQGAITGVT